MGVKLCSGLAIGLATLAVFASAIVQAAAAPTSTPASIPDGVRATLLADAQREALRNGDNHPHDIQAVSTTVRDAGELECDTHGFCGESDLYPPDTPVYVVAMRGHFSCARCSRPRGRPNPEGSVITLTILAETMFRTGLSIGAPYPNLKAVGTPILLDPPLAGSRHP